MPNGNVKKPPTDSGESGSSFARAELPRLDLLRSFEAAAHAEFYAGGGGAFSPSPQSAGRFSSSKKGSACPVRAAASVFAADGGWRSDAAGGDRLPERLRDATALVRAAPTLRQVSITTTPGFASIWLIPRLARVYGEPSAGGRAHFGDTGSARSGAFADRCRSALCAYSRRSRDAAVCRDRFAGLCAITAARRAASAEAATDLAHHTLLTVDAPAHYGAMMDWGRGWKLPVPVTLRMKNTLRFNHYADAVAAAVAGQGGDRTLPAAG